MKKLIAVKVDDLMYENFKVECIRKNVRIGQQLEKFMQGFSQNQKISDFLTYEEQTNPRIDMAIEEIRETISIMTSARAQELVFKLQEWQAGLIKK